MKAFTIPLPAGIAALALALWAVAPCAGAQPQIFRRSAGSHPHDVAASPRAGGPVFYTAQATGKLGILDPSTGRVEEIPLGANSAPHGVVVGRRRCGVDHRWRPERDRACRSR